MNLKIKKLLIFQDKIRELKERQNNSNTRISLTSSMIGNSKSQDSEPVCSNTGGIINLGKNSEISSPEEVKVEGETDINIDKETDNNKDVKEEA